MSVLQAMSSSATVTADASSSEAFKLLFSETTCGQVLERPSRSSGPKIPICLDTDLSVQDACNALAAHRISSAPVYSPEQGGFIGMFDYRDLVTYVLEVFRKVPKEEASFDAEMEITDIIKRASMDRTGVPIKLVSNLSSKTLSLLSLQEFANNSALHRIVVLEKCDGDKDKFVGVLSNPLFAVLSLKKLSLQQLGLVKGENSVVTVDLNDTVLEALYAMHTNHVSSVAIVDKAHGHSKLEGSVSMTDIKEILSSRGGWRHLYDPCFRFFVQLRSVQGLEANGSDRVPLFTVHPSTPLIVAVEKMAATKTHRVWIVSESGKGDVVGVLGLSDVMPFLAAACQPE
ncbi:CBS-domain-containing protein [Rhizoclosmatium globosum]|uniref:CBS-domain-containing protein n=1 Tax=Rhizoclosmatium globosum TaxID=329046 RepID=A0A1Y2CIB2_9FUNG|nr:CBS-domain-containing protein [Rhizoclosmatium globosum]|eukprot:ORY46783.1 CBS-domain-containing protein [Rhizoclosmatium globosum]